MNKTSSGYISIQLIEKSFHEELSDAERKELDKWLSASPLHREYYDRSRKTVKEGIDTNLDKRQLKRQFRKLNIMLSPHADTATLSLNPKRGRRNTIWLLCTSAAVVILALVFFFPAKESLKFEYSDVALDKHKNKAVIVIGGDHNVATEKLSQITIPGAGSISRNGDNILDYTGVTGDAAGMTNTILVPHSAEYEVILGDATRIRLNSESSLTFPVFFADDKREIHLTGEAYMEVTHDSQRPFIAHISNTEIKVHGTRFTVSGYDPQLVHASLLNGSISVLNKTSGREIFVHPNQSVVSFSDGSMEICDNVSDNKLAWLKGEFSFEKEKIEDIITILSKWYTIDNVTYYEDDIKEMRFTGSFSREVDIHTVLDLISMVSDISFKINGNNIEVSKN